MNPTRGYVERSVLPAALSLLPPSMDSAEARALLIAIGLQESRFEYRRQVRGPARGFWQFEQAGVRGVLNHHAAKPRLGPVLEALRVLPDECFEAIAHNDVLACVFARLLLWTHPQPLPREAAVAWRYYLATWRPGKPHRRTWDDFYASAWSVNE